MPSLMPLSLLSLIACTSTSSTPEAPPPAPPEAGSYLLARHPEAISDITLPARSRPGILPATFAVSWSMRADGTTYAGDVPTNALLAGGIPPGIAVVSARGDVLPFAETLAPGTWSFDGKQLLLSPPEGLLPDDYSLRDETAHALLARLNRRDAPEDMDDLAFLLRAERIKTAQRRGVYLPAPGQATWTLTVPKDGRLLADAALLSSPLRGDPASDGVTLHVEILGADGEAEGVVAVPVKPGAWEDIEADLSAWAGQTIRLRLRSDPGEGSDADYLMIGEPTLYTPKDSPRRMILIFADTLRADHMSLYGYARQTTPNIDRWAEGAAVFSEARTVAPWTYPAMRAALSGRLPDTWDAGPNLPERLATEGGWNTVAFVNNPYMNAVFGMDRGWGWHFYDDDLDASAMRRALLDAFDKSSDRDTLVLIQLLETHLPYDEPEPYRSLFLPPAQVADPPLPDPIRRRNLVEYTGDQALLAQYMVDRYDQSLRQLDRAIAPLLLDKLRPEDTVVFFADHGEALGDHGGWEHGHTLHEELLRVPLILSTPGVPAGGLRVDGRASLLDLTPTLLDIAGLPADPDLPGSSLLPAATGRAPLPARPQGFGYILYGDDAWGAVAQDSGLKVVSRSGTLTAWDLAADPGEQSPMPRQEAAEVEAAVQILAQGFGRPIVSALRLVSLAEPLQRDDDLTLTAEGGLQAVWTGLEGPRIPPATIRDGDDGSVQVVGGGGVLPREVFAVPADPHAEVRVTDAERALEQGPMWVPLPAGARLKTTAASVEGQLRALGYVE